MNGKVELSRREGHLKVRRKLCQVGTFPLHGFSFPISLTCCLGEATLLRPPCAGGFFFSSHPDQQPVAHHLPLGRQGRPRCENHRLPLNPMKRETERLPLTNTAAAMLRDFLDDYGLTQTKLAADVRLSPQLLNDILAGRRLLTPEHCLKLGRYFGNEPEYWMRLQNHYLFRKTQHEKAAELDAVVPLKVAS